MEFEMMELRRDCLGMALTRAERTGENDFNDILANAKAFMKFVEGHDEKPTPESKAA